MAEHLQHLRARLAHLGRLFAAACHAGLSVALWLGGTLLASLGIVLAVALLATGLEFGRFFEHLQNLSSHYLLADPHARAKFERDLVGLWFALLGLLVIARLPAFAARLRRELTEGNRHG